MPKGQKRVIWTPDQESRLFHAILAAHQFTIDYNLVAKAFGDNVPGSCIATHMTKLRRKANALGQELGFKPQPTTTKAFPSASNNTKATSRPTAAQDAKATTSEKRKRGSDFSDDEDRDDSSDTMGNADDEKADLGSRSAAKTPSRQMSIAGKVTKPRQSPRKAAKTDYKKLEDPFHSLDEKDEEGNRLFDTDKSESEDSQASDEEYEQETPLVKMEEREDGLAV